MAAPVVERIAWSVELAEGLGDTIADDPAGIQADVQRGDAQAWRINDGGAYVVTRIDHGETRRECVVVACAGNDLRGITPIIYQAAKAAGCDRIRWHTERPALARLVARDFDVERLETVFTVRVQHGW